MTDASSLETTARPGADGETDDDAAPAPAHRADTDTVDLGVAGPARPLPVPEGLDDVLRHLDDACPVITADPLQAPEIGARYVIGEELGSGAIGQVIEAVDTHLSRRVAIKILHGGAGVSRERLSRFIAEAQITAQLDHPAIVPVYEIGRMPGGMPYFTMKRVEGESLEDIINNLRVGDAAYRERWTMRGLVRTFRRLCQGVAYAHAKGVIHRDLKPSNIMLGRYGEVLIMDWGLAKVMQESRIQGVDALRAAADGRRLDTLDGAIAGTPAYMSPEQARGEVRLVGPPSDVYCLGLMLAELITLTRVYRTDSPDRTLDEVRRGGPVELATLKGREKIDPELDAIVRNCTDPDPAARYPNAGELAEDLRRYLDHQELATHPDTHHRRAVKWSRRNPLLAGLLLGLGLGAGLAAGTAALLWSLGHLGPL